MNKWVLKIGKATPWTAKARTKSMKTVIGLLCCSKANRTVNYFYLWQCIRSDAMAITLFDKLSMIIHTLPKYLNLLPISIDHDTLCNTTVSTTLSKCVSQWDTKSIEQKMQHSAKQPCIAIDFICRFFYWNHANSVHLKWITF